MDSAIVDALLALNRTFYDKFAGDFARTRRSSPPGFDLIVPYLLPAANVLDLGCGNGRLLNYLVTQGWHGFYTGLDNSAGLLAEARRAAESADASAAFVEADLMQDWPLSGRLLQPGDAITMLAVLHHIPGQANRRRILGRAAALMPPGSRLILSTWQFMTSERLRNRLLPWEAAGFQAGSLERTDYLMSWGQGAAGQRYVAAIDGVELEELAAGTGLRALSTFTTDGLEGDLNLYAVFEPEPK